MFQDDRAKQVEVAPASDPFSLDALIAWLRTKPADCAYCYLDGGRCLFATYLTEVVGLSDVSVGDNYYRHGPGPYPRTENPLPNGWGRLASLGERTYGAALSRALSLQTEGR